MVQDIQRTRPTETTSAQANGQFPASAPAANPVFYRTYSRKLTGTQRESWTEVTSRTLKGLVELGKFTPEETALVRKMQQEMKCLPSGRWLWVGGTEWVTKPENFNGSYNCTSTNVVDWAAFGLMMDLAMMGCGTGAILEPKYTNRLPEIRNRLIVKMGWGIGTVPEADRVETTEIKFNGNAVEIIAGDSRRGWVDSYQRLLELSTDDRFTGDVTITIDLGNIRPAGEKLKGFGGVANPVKLPPLYERCTQILNKAIGRKLSPVECCLLIDEAAACVVAGNIRRCLPFDSLVHTSKGLVPIQDVQVGDLVQTPIGFRRVVDKFDQGMQDVYEIETNATSPRATLNHRQAVLADAKGSIKWKSIAGLDAGDRLMHSTQILSGTVTHLPTDFTIDRPEQSRTAKPITIPALTADVAWLIGFTHGDGYVALGRNNLNKPYGRVEWSMNGLDETSSHIQSKLDRALELFGVTVTHGAVKGENTLKSVCSSIRLAEYFHAFIKQPNVPLTVPTFILQGSIDIRSAYLAGLMDSDGAVNNRPPHLVTSVYRSFVRQVGVVLSSLGIAGRVTTVRPQNETWQVKYNLTLPALKGQYNALVAPHSVKGEIRQGLKTYGFTIPGEVMREVYSYSEMREMGFQGNRSVDSNYERYIAESDVVMDIPVTVKGLGSYDHVQTYDIEVEEAHCFYCDGYLTHNSAGMRQGNSGDTEFASAKDNLWQQGEDGNWRIDPERDAYRMANHTRVYHHKPTKQEVLDAVRKQFHSGEGAIQYAPEAIARSSADLLPNRDQQIEFITAYESGKGAEFLLTLKSDMPTEEIEHRLGRYGLNPCVTADTWVHTESGARQVKDLIGQQHGTYINGELFSTTADGFFFSGVKAVVKLSTQEGHSLRLTGNHRVLKVTAQTQKAQYTEWVETKDLQPGDRVLIHNHRGLQPWSGVGTVNEGWLLGSLLGDGCFAVSEKNHVYQANLRYWGEDQVEMKEYALALANELTPDAPKPLQGCYHTSNQYYQVSSSPLAQLAKQFGVVAGHKTITPTIEEASHEFYCGFLRGLFDADGSVQGTQIKGVSVRLAQSNESLLEAVQRMLLRLGISSTIYRNRRPEQVRLMPNSKRELAEYACKAQHELVIANDNLPVFLETIGFQEPKKQELLTSLLSAYKRKLNRDRFAVTVSEITPDGTEAVYDCTVPGISRFDANGFVAHNCGEIIGEDFHCNLSEIHLNQIDPNDYQAQDDAFTAGGLTVAGLLNHQFTEPRYQKSRLMDPIVGVSFTGLFDFFVQAFGTEWLNWWEAGRPDTMRGLEFKSKEQEYLSRWKATVHRVVGEYCLKHGLKVPNRCTTVQPAGTKSLLTGASSGWHPPKAQRFIRRITFRKNDPVAMACLDYGYSIVPSQSDKDDQGNLLNDPFDSRCTEWLVEIPVEVPWANIPGADEVSIEMFSATAQFDFYMQVQKYYTAHNTSATIELREDEIDALADVIYDSVETNGGYMSAALLARFDAPFPRLPFEKIDRATYLALSAEVKGRRKTDDFYGALAKYDSGEMITEGPAGCDSDKCLFAAESK
jgi:ribonucleotide reductase, class II